MFLIDEIVKIESVDCDSLRYDITVADNHNFFANDILVHNCQNCYHLNKELFDTDATWEVQEKCEGSSITIAFKDGEVTVCSRNLALKESMDNTFYKTAVEYEIPKNLSSYGKNISIVGELCGPGIQGNIYGLTKHQIFVFDVFDIDQQRYLSPVDRNKIVNLFGLTYAPILYPDFSLKDKTCQEILSLANGKSVLGYTDTLREGLVFKMNSDERVSFKSISNEYLLKQK